MSPPSDAQRPQWVRMRFRGGKVWVAADARNRPLLQEGLARMKYRLDQTQEYRVRGLSLAPLDDASDPPAAAPPPRRPEKAPGARPSGAEPAEAADGIQVFTDGACSGNPGPSGIGVVLKYGERRREISEYIGEATNNVAELTAILRGLAAVRKKNLPVRVYTDSAYAYGVLRLNWKPKKNLDLIAAVRRQMAAFADLRFIKVKGHHGVPENERADHLATSAIGRGGR